MGVEHSLRTLPWTRFWRCVADRTPDRFRCRSVVETASGDQHASLLTLRQLPSTLADTLRCLRAVRPHISKSASTGRGPSECSTPMRLFDLLIRLSTSIESIHPDPLLDAVKPQRTLEYHREWRYRSTTRGSPTKTSTFVARPSRSRRRIANPFASECNANRSHRRYKSRRRSTTWLAIRRLARYVPWQYPA